MLLVLSILGLAYLFLATAGTMRRFETYTIFYDLLADCFREGHLNLSITPPPALVRDPFGVAHRDLWFWDATYYNGKYFIYWGPFPALIQALLKTAFRIRGTVGDEYAALVMYVVYLLSGGLLIERVWCRLFDALPRGLLWLSVVAFAFAHPTPYLVSSGSVYEAAIAGGQAFLLAGLVFAFDAVWSTPTHSEPRARLLAAGTLWSIALACRISVAFAVPLLMLATAGCMTSATARDWKRRSRCLAWMGGPVALVVCMLLTYNKLRFDAWFDFGVHRQLTTTPFRANLEYLQANLYSYLLRPIRVACEFPYLFPERSIRALRFPSWFQVPRGYSTAEALTGYLLTLPLAWLCPLPLLLHSKAGVPADAIARGRVWCVACFTILAIVPALPTLGQSVATMRYLGDSAAGVVLLGILAIWTLVWRARHRQALRCVALGFGSCVLLATVALGLLFGVQGYYDQFRKVNPRLYEAIARPLSLCRKTSSSDLRAPQ